MPMPTLSRYRCYKEVWAAKIKQVLHGDDGIAQITFVNSWDKPVFVSEAYMARHQPKAGGYYVIHEDGYESFSPAAAFESGYTLITGEEDES